MTDDELTRLAGECVMGWTWVKRKGLWMVEEDGEMCQAEGPHWSPLTDWRAAGEVLEKMRAAGWSAYTTSRNFGFLCPEGIGGLLPSPISPRVITQSAPLAVRAITEEQL